MLSRKLARVSGVASSHMLHLAPFHMYFKIHYFRIYFSLGSVFVVAAPVHIYSIYVILLITLIVSTARPFPLIIAIIVNKPL